MISENLRGNWHELKRKIQTTWSRLSDDDLRKVENNWGALPARLEKAYGLTEEEAQEEIENFESKCLKENSDLPEFKATRETSTDRDRF